MLFRSSFNTWLIELLLESKRFLGKFHKDHPLYSLTARTRKMQETKEIVVSRFGWWDSCDYPEDLAHFNFHCERMFNVLQGMPKYLADYRAKKTLNYEHEPHDDSKGWRRKNYIHDLVNHFGVSEAEATRKVDKYFAHYNIEPTPEKPIDPAQKEANNKKMAEHYNKLIEILRFYTSPKARANYLKRSCTFLDHLYLTFLVKKYGRTWFVENIGEIEGVT